MENNYDEIDNLFIEYFNNNQEVPIMITNGIETAMYTEKKRYDLIELIKKIIITIVSFLTVASGIVFAKDIKDLIDNLVQNLFGNYNNGINTAIENGYIEDIDMEYVEFNNTKVKIDHITLDDYNLGIVFNIESNIKDYLDDFYNVRIMNLLIMDENNNVLFSEYENQEEFYKYCEENSLDKGKYGIGYANCASNGNILSVNDNNIIYSFYTTSDKFPSSKELHIRFNKIALLSKASSSISTESYTATFDGNWEFNIDLERSKSSRKTIEYNVTNINDKKTTIEKASLSMSNMRLELITNSNKIDFKKLQNREKANVIDLIPFHESYIETENGEKFFESNSNNNGYNTLENGKIKYYTNFDYTYFDKSETIKIVLPTNKRKDLIIEMKANNFEAQQH